MIYLKISNSIHILLFFLLSGCATSSFMVLMQEENAAEFKVTPDRVVLECEHQHDSDSKDPNDAYGFLMRILDGENTVLTVAQTNVLDKESCSRRIHKIGKILKTGKMVYIGGIGYLNKPKIKGEQKYTFHNIGTFYDNGQSLQFVVIANERGFCYDAYSGDESPCPREPFLLKNLK
ncbi:MAG: hypothetical protein AABZ06_08730 [Bdellovibrionota bacterium]